MFFQTCPYCIGELFVDTTSYLEDLETIVNETPYWMREVHGKYIIDRLRKFVIDNGGAEPREWQKKNNYCAPQNSMIQ
jgi:hypothetical protein